MCPASLAESRIHSRVFFPKCRLYLLPEEVPYTCAIIIMHDVGRVVRIALSRVIPN